MIAAARKRLGDTDAVTFHNGRFEDVDLPEAAFKAVFSATAFHWVDPQVGWAKAASLLEDGGVLALLVYTTLRDEMSEALEEEFVDLVRKHAPEFEADPRLPRELDVILAGAEERRSNASEVWNWLMSDGRHDLGLPEAGALFEDVQVDADVRVVEETADELIAHLRTTSLYFRVAADRREAFEEDERRIVESHGGAIRRSFATLLMTARKS
jgi:ubiquinone/menaquinone biosynthesis C-methylase UbiE